MTRNQLRARLHELLEESMDILEKLHPVPTDLEVRRAENILSNPSRDLAARMAATIRKAQQK